MSTDFPVIRLLHTEVREIRRTFTVTPEDEIRMIYFHTGRIQMNLSPVDGGMQTFMSDAGHLWYVPAGYGAQCVPVDSVVVMHTIHFSYTTEQDIPQILIGDRPLCLHLPRLQVTLARTLLPEGKLQPADALRLQARLYELLALLVDYGQDPERTIGVGSGRQMPAAAQTVDADAVEQTCRYMRDRFHESIDLKEWAQSFGLSPSRFYRAFRERTGFSPYQWLISTRLKASLNMLSASSIPVMDVAHAVGYRDELYFSRLFHRKMGMTATEYRERAQIRIANLCPVFAGDLAAMGINPVLQLQTGWQQEPAHSLEQIMQARPDRIFTSPVPEEIGRKLKRLAPVHIVRWKGVPWQERLQQISNILGLNTIAEQWLRQFHVKVDIARRHVRESIGQRPFLIARLIPAGFRLYGQKRYQIRDLFYDKLQIRAPQTIQTIPFLDVPRLDPIAKLRCGSLLLLVPHSTSAEQVKQYEQQWHRLARQHEQDTHCLILRHEEPLLYNTSCYESLVDQMVRQLQRSRSTVR